MPGRDCEPAPPKGPCRRGRDVPGGKLVEPQRTHGRRRPSCNTGGIPACRPDEDATAAAPEKKTDSGPRCSAPPGPGVRTPGTRRPDARKEPPAGLPFAELAACCEIGADGPALHRCGSGSASFSPSGERTVTPALVQSGTTSTTPRRYERRPPL